MYSEKLVSYRNTTRRHNPENRDMNHHLYEDLKTDTLKVVNKFYFQTCQYSTTPDETVSFFKMFTVQKYTYHTGYRPHYCCTYHGLYPPAYSVS